ncbi:hypothetical protein [Lyngbya sp. CCY1209]|uniref:hypothetical protein n=1 Tax=Lyngbya sp. CCY1209 TaxID=2886103 RepID=UPI002D20F4DA|nr:hypothetical protein [Lyngbya sp. CCY1209]MEB3885361.1 hypothetical protein [Lyngbya sp. CCY1209]
MLKAKLSPCASLLYEWIRAHVSRGDRAIKLDLESFRIWTGEYLEKAASWAEINASLSQLAKLRLIAIEGTWVRLNPKPRPVQVFSFSQNGLVTKNLDNNSLFWGMLIAVGFFLAWSSSQNLSTRMDESQTNTPAYLEKPELLLNLS